MTEDEDKSFSVRIFTSSHGLSSHFFPQALKSVFESRNLIKYPSVDAEGGRVFSDAFMDHYKLEFEKIKQAGEPTISILLLGDNNIRAQAVRGAFRVCKYTKEIIELHKNTCHPLLVCGLMPSPETWPKSLLLCEHVDDVLQETIEQLHCNPAGRFFGFVCTTSFFTDSEGFVISKKHFSKDGIHLNELGAHVLALNLLSNARVLAATVQAYND